MINTIQSRENINQINGISALQEDAIKETNNTKDIVKDFEETENKTIKKETERKNNEIIEKKMVIKYKGKVLEGMETIGEVLKDNQKKPEEKIQIIVESIHTREEKGVQNLVKNRIDTKNEKNSPFYCGDRSLLLYQIFDKYKEFLGITESNIARPYGHLMNIIKIDDKTYIADAGAGCFNEVTNNIEITKKGTWEIVKLKSPIRLYEDSDKFYGFTTFPTTKNLGNEQFLYTTSDIQMYSYYITDKLYKKAQTTTGYENANTIENLESFLEDVLYKKDSPYEGILEDSDVLLTFPKQDQIDMIKGQIYHRLSYKDNDNKINNFKNALENICKNHPEYNLDGREALLSEFYKDDRDRTKDLNISDEDKGAILELLKKNVSKEADTTNENLTEKIIKKLLNNMDTEISILGEDNKELDQKLKKYLKALNVLANQANSTIEAELEKMFKDLLKGK